MEKEFKISVNVQAVFELMCGLAGRLNEVDDVLEDCRSTYVLYYKGYRNDLMDVLKMLMQIYVQLED